MSAADKAREIVQDLTGMWWPDADKDDLREAARAWRTFADAVEDVAAATNKQARSLIENNKGESIEAFDAFWRRYVDNGKGWLKDLPDAARDMAKALDQYADAVHEATTRLEHELEVVGATIVAGTALAFFTAGISEGAAVAATITITELAGELGVAVSAEVATIAGTTLTTVAIGGIESATVDLAVAQPLRIAQGEQSGLNLDEVHDAALYGGLTAGALTGSAGLYRSIQGAGGIRSVLDGLSLGPLNEPQLAYPGVSLPSTGTGSGLDQYKLFAWEDIPQEVRDNWTLGNKFNKDNHSRYPANEVHLTNGKLLDSYKPGEEIVSRKYTQLSEIQPKTARSYLDEIVNKYEPDTIIRSDKYPQLDGKPLEGEMVLEVPVQNTPIPAEIIEHARDLDITIRDINGNVYT